MWIQPKEKEVFLNTCGHCFGIKLIVALEWVELGEHDSRGWVGITQTCELWIPTQITTLKGGGLLLTVCLSTCKVIVKYLGWKGLGNLKNGNIIYDFIIYPFTRPCLDTFKTCLVFVNQICKPSGYYIMLRTWLWLDDGHCSKSKIP